MPYPDSLPMPQTSTVTKGERRALSNEQQPREALPLQLDGMEFEELSWPPLDSSQMATLLGWWRTELLYGGAWFVATWPLPRGTVEAVRKFISPLRREFVPAANGGRWRVTATCEVRGEGVFPSEPSVGGNPWLFFPTTGSEADYENWSPGPLHKVTFDYRPLNSPPEPFVTNVGITDDFGDGNNNNSVTDIYIPLFGDSGVPQEGQYTWEPADPEDTIVPTFTDSDPSGDGTWAGANLFVSLSALGGPMIGWGGGVLTLYAGNNLSTGFGQITIITFLPSTFVYPPISVYYGPLS